MENAAAYCHWCGEWSDYPLEYVEIDKEIIKNTEIVFRQGWVCNDCKTKYSFSSVLRNTARDINKIKCPFCSFSTTSKDILETHKESHWCSVCKDYGKRTGCCSNLPFCINEHKNEKGEVTYPESIGPGMVGKKWEQTEAGKKRRGKK